MILTTPSLAESCIWRENGAFVGVREDKPENGGARPSAARFCAQSSSFPLAFVREVPVRRASTSRGAGVVMGVPLAGNTPGQSKVQPTNQAEHRDQGESRCPTRSVELQRARLSSRLRTVRTDLVARLTSTDLYAWLMCRLRA
jgi:hypothetical protein